MNRILPIFIICNLLITEEETNIYVKLHVRK